MSLSTKQGLLVTQGEIDREIEKIRFFYILT